MQDFLRLFHDLLCVYEKEIKRWHVSTMVPEYGDSVVWSLMAFVHTVTDLEHSLNNAVYLTIVNSRSNLAASDPLPPPPLEQC